MKTYILKLLGEYTDDPDINICVSRNKQTLQDIINKVMFDFNKQKSIAECKYPDVQFTIEINDKCFGERNVLYSEPIFVINEIMEIE